MVAATQDRAHQRWLSALRRRLADAGLDGILVRATDRYLNEYVPLDESDRAFITGFTGSMGDAIITPDRALLFVDGRYTLQASREARDFECTTVPLGTSIEQGWMKAFAGLVEGGVKRLAVDTAQVTVSLFEQMLNSAQPAGLELVALTPSPVTELRLEALAGADANPSTTGKFWSVEKALTGPTVGERLGLAAPDYDAAGIDGVVLIPLDEIAWVTNLRGDQIPYQATFKSQAVALRDRVILAADKRHKRRGAALDEAIHLVEEGGLGAALAELIRERGALTLGYDPTSTPQAVKQALEDGGATLVAAASPFASRRHIKTEAELDHMKAAFATADLAVHKLQRWVNREVAKGAEVSEHDVAEKMKALHKRAGAWGLSFQVIAGAGENGAIIHYSNPDPNRLVKAGEVFLLDTGAYFEGGYATDLTRTFLVGGRETKATERQKELFTVVLKAAIAGMSARFPAGTTGGQLDAIVRDPMWRAGFDYAHGTGHGVGVNVHEAPPRVRPGDANALEPGQVFSIEPGVYIAGEGGVRIENLCTVEPDPQTDGYLRVVPLTFSPLDARLIDNKMLSAHERAFLKWFKARWKLTPAERPAAFAL